MLEILLSQAEALWPTFNRGSFASLCQVHPLWNKIKSVDFMKGLVKRQASFLLQHSWILTAGHNGDRDQGPSFVMGRALGALCHFFLP